MFAGRLRRGFRAGLAVVGKLWLSKRSIVAGLGEGTTLAKSSSIAGVLAIIVDAFATLRAGDARRLVARHLTRVDRDRNPLFMEEVFIRKLAISKHLLLVFIFDLREEFASTLLGRLERGNTKGPENRNIALRCQGRREVDKCCGHLPPVAKFDGALAQAASGDDGNRIGGATVDLYERHKALAVGTLGICDTKPFATQHGHADAENLAGAKVAVGDLGFAEKGVKRLHNFMILLEAAARFF
jgi:hypothetical protein